jgi:hypothetical protein
MYGSHLHAGALLPQRSAGVVGSRTRCRRPVNGGSELSAAALHQRPGLAQFKGRNLAAIDQVRNHLAKGLALELVGLWSVEKRARGLVLEQVLDDVDERLQSPGLTDAAWIKCQTLKVKVTRELSELYGQLPTRSVVEVSSAPRLVHEVVGFSADKWLKRLEAEGPYVPEAPAESDRGTASEPAAPPTAPAPESHSPGVRFLS